MKNLGRICALLLIGVFPLVVGRTHEWRKIRDLAGIDTGLAMVVLPRHFYKDRSVTIYHGDCRGILPSLRAESVDMVWTDPPYGNNNQNGDLADSRNRWLGRKSRPIANDGRKEMMRVVDFML